MGDPREAGLKAYARQVAALYRKGFSTAGQRLAKERAVAALVAAGCTVVIDFWGGGQTSRALVAAGLRVIAVENGAMRLKDGAGRLIGAKWKRAALEQDGRDGGFEVFWGDFEDAILAYPEADGAFLDFHGPWSESAYSAVRAARHMRAVVVTLMPDHDMRTGARNYGERRRAYQLYLRMARTGMDEPTEYAISRSGGARVLIDYENASGKRICVYLLSRGTVHLPPVKLSDRSKMLSEVMDKKRGRQRAHYHGLDETSKAHRNAKTRHNDHIRTGRLPVLPCPSCGQQREPSRCPLCDAVIPVKRALKGARYCTDGCMRQEKLNRQRTSRSQTPRPMRIISCDRCGTMFTPAPNNNLTRPLCGHSCREAVNRERKAEWYQMRKAAVSGTAAEAISSEEAA